MTIGPGTFSPGPRFGFPRSYINDFYVFRNGNTIVKAANKFVVTDATNPNLTATFVIDQKFYFWSSNAWTMDHIIVESYYQNTPGGTEFELPYNLFFDQGSRPGRNALYLGWSGLVSSPELFAIPGQQESYWLPNPLP